MKKIIYAILVFGVLLGQYSCQKEFLNLNPPSNFTDVVYFKKASDFKAFSGGFYSQLMGWQSPYDNIYNHMDLASDLSCFFSGGFSVDVGRGTITVPATDNRWDNAYTYIRSTNILLSKAAAYAGSDNISQYVSEAYFFRAYAYFNLLSVFGGVPIVTDVLDVNSAELTAPRNSRYEVITLILSDLDKAIANLPTEQMIPSTDKGRISKWAAEAFKAQVELYEATWRKYNGVTTDFAGSAGPAKDEVTTFLSDAVALTKDVMDNGGYSLWYYAQPDSSYTYLFNLEDAGSNPAGMTKASNNEFILYGVYDYNLRKGGINLTWTAWEMQTSRKMIDMFLCKDGLPIDKSPLFMGYHGAGDEYKNRDLRLYDYIGAGPKNGTFTLSGGYSGYGNLKFAEYHWGSYRHDLEESPNYSIIRLPLVYVMYAEALVELNGGITDAQLDASINKIRDRAGVAHLSNALASTYSLNILDEIRRERTLELFHEGFRYDDLKRWGIAEDALNASRCGEVVGDASYPTDFRGATGAATSKYVPSDYVWGEEAVTTGAGTLNCVVIDSKTNHTWTKKDYLWPIPQTQINLNPNLKQNPGY